jgi:hypothetical protein
MMRNYYKLIFTGLLIFSPLFLLHGASQLKGTSLGEYYYGCDYYLIEDSYGDYSLVEWYGGITPDSGEIVYGELHSYGFKDLYNITRDRETRVWIDDWLLSSSRAAEKLIDKCGYHGSVEDYLGSSYSYSYYPTYSPPTPAPAPVSSCPANSYLSGEECFCNDGYAPNSESNSCVSITQYCQSIYGGFSYGSGKSCYCHNGYQLNESKNACVISITKPATPAPTTIKEESSPTSSISKETLGTEVNATRTFSFDETKVQLYISAIPTTLKIPGAFRECPSKECRVVRYYAETTDVDILGNYLDKEWYKLRVKNDSGETIEGWMHSSILNDFDENINYQTASSSAQVENTGWLKRIWYFFRTLF